MRSILASICCVLLAVSIVFAHGNEQHVMGTVSAIGTNSITIKTTSGALTETLLTDKTKFSKSGQTVTLKDIHVGDRVVVHAAKHDGKLEATTVQVGTAPAQPASAKNAKH